jgi:hypothetical protein
MRRTGFSVAVAVSGLMFAAACGTTQARPIAPLSPGIAGAANITPVYYYHHYWYRHHYWYHPYWYYGFDPTAHNWDYYRVDQPGRGNNVESTR